MQPNTQQPVAVAKLLEGRIVWKSGDLFKGQPQTVYGSQTPKLDKNGKQAIQYGFGLAVPKMKDGQQNAQLMDFMQSMQGEALKVYPSGHIPPSFAYKFKDGDTAIDEKGVPYNQRPGYAGCIVFSLTTQMPINWFRYESGKNIMINEGVKCGDYVRTQVTMKAHPSEGSGKAGMYLNPNAVQLIGYGEEIVSRGNAMLADGDAIFGATAPVTPMGASSQPVAPPGQFPGMTAVPAQPYGGVLPQHMQQGFQQPQQAPIPGQFMQPGQSQQPAMYPPQQPAMGATQPQQPQTGFGFPFTGQR